MGCLGGGKGGGEWVWDGMDDERYGYGYGMDAWEFVGAVDSGNSYGNNNSYCYSNCYGYGNGNVPKTVVRQVPR